MRGIISHSLMPVQLRFEKNNHGEITFCRDKRAGQNGYSCKLCRQKVSKSSKSSTVGQRDSGELIKLLNMPEKRYRRGISEAQ